MCGMLTTIMSGRRSSIFGQRNLASDDPTTWHVQMAASAKHLSKIDPLSHWVISWPLGVQPPKADVAEMIDLALETMNATDLHSVWSVHSNTDNWHAHVLPSRIDPVTWAPR